MFNRFIQTHSKALIIENAQAARAALALKHFIFVERFLKCDLAPARFGTRL
jgi:hypothetical protein